MTAEDSLEELIADAYARGFRDGWDRPDHMTVPEDLLALEEHYERMAALRLSRRLARDRGDGYVQHLDGDPYNNDPANLVIVPPRTEEA